MSYFQNFKAQAYQSFLLTFMSLMALALTLQLSACKKDKILTDNAILEFSADTLQFDTVFTAQGSSTKWFKIYNPENQAIEISQILLNGGNNSDFKINIDGVEATSQSNILLRAKDSMYIFVMAYINPDRGDAIIEDSISFIIGGNEQKVYLSAYGWNANYIGALGDTTWYVNTTFTLDNTKPNIILGWHAFVDATLVIPPATKVYMHGGPTNKPAHRAFFYLGENASAQVGVNGDFTNPVIIQTHRLEADFQDFPYHHDGFYFTANSRDNKIHNTIIRNATNAIIVDSLSINSNPKLELHNTFIYNVEEAGIIGFNASIKATNTIIANSNQYNMILVKGGQYEFTHCTFANYATTSFLTRKKPIITMRNYQVVYNAAGQREIIYNTGNFDFRNSIIYGTKSDEIEVDLGNNNSIPLTINFEHCLIKKDTFASNFQNCIFNQDPLFENRDEYNYSLDSTNSPAYQVGMNTNITLDILGNPRSNTPDLGAYEYQQ